MIYNQDSHPVFPWINTYSSREHVFMQCYWCKRKLHISVTAAEDMQVAEMRNMNKEFVELHRDCQDKSRQLELPL